MDGDHNIESKRTLIKRKINLNEQKKIVLLENNFREIKEIPEPRIDLSGVEIVPARPVDPNSVIDGEKELKKYLANKQ